MPRSHLDSLGRQDSWDGVRAVVAGFGVSGFAAADNLNHMGATVTALDEVSTPALNFPAANNRDLAPPLQFAGATVDGQAHAVSPYLAASEARY